MAILFKTKKLRPRFLGSFNKGRVPDISDVGERELAFNAEDKRIWTSDGVVLKELTTNSGIEFNAAYYYPAGTVVTNFGRAFVAAVDIVPNGNDIFRRDEWLDIGERIQYRAGLDGGLASSVYTPVEFWDGGGA